MERSYESAAALGHGALGPLADHLDDFVASLISQQYVPAVVDVKALHAVAFDRWLAKRGVTLADRRDPYPAVPAAHSTSTSRPLPEPRRRERCDVSEVLNRRVLAVCAIPAAMTEYPPDVLVTSFAQHLQHHRGLATATIRTPAGLQSASA